MIKINPAAIPPASQTQRKKKVSNNSNSSSFSGLLKVEDESEETAPVHQSSPVHSINPFLSLQEISEDEAERRQAVKQGFDALDQLEELRHALLIGTVPANMLSRIEAMVAKERHRHTDPNTQAILDEIELRTAVELAKLERAMSFTS